MARHGSTTRLLEWARLRTTPWWRFSAWLIGAGAAFGALSLPFSGGGEPALEVAVLGGAFFAWWLPLLALFFAGLASDYVQQGRVLTGLAGASTPFTLRRAWWPPFTTSLALFLGLVVLAGNAGLSSAAAWPGLVDLGPAADVVVGTVGAGACALLAGLLGSAGAPRGAGIDGEVLLVDRWPFFRSVPLASIAHASVSVERRQIVIQRHDGARVVVPLGAGCEAAAAQLVATLRARLSERWLEPDADPARWAVLDRAGDSLAAWQSRLAALARGGDYRMPAIGQGDLRALLGALDTPAERRLAAALALRALGDVEGIARQRARAPARMRVALEAIEEGSIEPEQIEDALAEERRAR